MTLGIGFSVLTDMKRKVKNLFSATSSNEYKYLFCHTSLQVLPTLLFENIYPIEYRSLPHEI